MAQLALHSLSPAATASLGGTGTGQGGSDYSLALYSFLDRLSPIMLDRLYASSSSVLSIFRLLPLTARHLVLNLLWMSSPTNDDDPDNNDDESEEQEGPSEATLKEMAVWVRERKSDGPDKSERRHLNASLSALARLHILTPQAPPRTFQQDDQDEIMIQDDESESATVTDATVFRMNDKFRTSLRQALTGGGKPAAFGQPVSEPDPNVTVQFLDQHAETQWETIQHFMVNYADPTRAKPSDKVLQLLYQSGLMHSDTRSLRSMRITSKGFQFLLEDVNTQLWDLLLTYLESSEDLVETIGFLFMLGSLELGRGYVSDRMSPSQLQVLADLADYGLVYRASPTSSTFYPTRLATTLTSSAPPLLSTLHGQAESQGFLVLETNYKLYAYTSNPLQIAVMGLFASLKTRFANFVTGMITRESVRRGLENGITANQIISYLTTRAHPQMVALHQARQGKHNEDQNLLPTTVVDQIRLWEHERRRIKHTEAYLYDDFSSDHDYSLVANYARDLRVVLLELPRQRKLVVTGSGHEIVREFIKRRMEVARAEAEAGRGPGMNGTG
ncbi:TFIIH/NER complex subunit TFB2 [Sporobolomyces koalae]|uniref:TFIIH/NER complex subunit TFB2 n=1 Tax=Sporobolomyces koalae TaxID=500713 RepID=UPI003170C7C0